MVLDLSDPIWQKLAAGYRVTYDASSALRSLENAQSVGEEKVVWDELWQELHHQGDVDEASYAAVPHLLRIAKSKAKLNWNCFGLIAVIELERHNPRNPPVPDYLSEAYREALKTVGSIAFGHHDQDWDELLTSQVFSAIAASKGHHTIARALLELTDSEMAQAFLDKVIFG